MRLKNYLPVFRDEGSVIAMFGEAKLIKFLNGKFELRGGSQEDRISAHEWISLFFHEIVVHER
jgi:hypothetical protein